MNYDSTAYAQDGGHYVKEQHHTYQFNQHYPATAAEMEEYEHNEHVQLTHPPSESEGTPDSPQYEQGGGDENGYEQRNDYYQQQQEVLASAEDAQVFQTAPGEQPQARPSVDILPSLDITYELKFVKDRLATIARDEDPEEEPERLALSEIERSTEALIASRKVLSERQRQLAFMDAGDSQRPALQAEVTQLMSESKYKERQWTANKEAYYREFSSGTAVVITSTTGTSVGADGIPEPIAPVPRKLSPAEEEMKARAEKDVKVLQDQIALLQKQLDAVASRRKQMAIDAEEYQRRTEY
ncbi:hypothetical protein BGZ93_003774 [Podila epicladia]|nr:hypothetical protein BGZ92_000769 [Podila epicladia]KAG0096921.1 hypothetical protein BGZ93_003774 [Podila epicladia]